MEPRFKIIGNEVKEQMIMNEPRFSDYGGYFDTEFQEERFHTDLSRRNYENAMTCYEERQKMMRTYIASPELKERFGDNEFGEKDFEVRKKCEWPNCGCSGFWCDKYQLEAATLIAYPVSQEQESQEETFRSIPILTFDKSGSGMWTAAYGMFVAQGKSRAEVVGGIGQQVAKHFATMEARVINYTKNK
jgi:hypothetical protein